MSHKGLKREFDFYRIDFPLNHVELPSVLVMEFAVSQASFKQTLNEECTKLLSEAFGMKSRRVDYRNLGDICEAAYALGYSVSAFTSEDQRATLILSRNDTR
eukprot:TRINITY_DN17743_c0_g1_i2.p2 TRINITY_DN17743_c0_g1~~TRINITY_DN17743_c0_g1_i2.p2  ORF type:complete len:102 (+),score=1.47 TRINITY_DN17743_c0_g1_i2:67-372(+)